MGKAQQWEKSWEMWGIWHIEGGRECVEGEDGGGETGKGTGGMVASIALETQFFMVVMASEVLKSSGSTWVSSSSLMNWYVLSPTMQ